MNSDKACVLLTPRPASCIFQTADEKDDLPGVGDESVLEMLSYSKFSDLEAWLCMPSSLLRPRSLDSSSTSSSSSSSVRSTDQSSEKVHSFLSPTLVRDPQFLSTPVLTSTPLTSMTSVTSGVTPAVTSSVTSDLSCGGVAVRKRRRLGASPGGLHWNSAGSVQRDFLSPQSHDPPPRATGVREGGASATGARGGGASVTGASGERNLEGRGGVVSAGGRSLDSVVLRKSVDNQFLQSSSKLKLLTRLERGTRKLRNCQTVGASGRYDARKKDDAGRAHKWKRWSLGDGLNADFTSLFYSGLNQSTASLDRRGGAMQSLQLSAPRPGPASPSAAKRLYRNLSEKLRGSSSSFEDTYFFGKTDRLRKASAVQYSEVLLEAVEQQDLDSVQILLFQVGPEDLDLNTPDSQGLTALDISIMTNNTPIAKLLLKAGAKESPIFDSVESREAHLSVLVVEAERRAADLAAQAQREGLSLDACQNHKPLRAWEWRSRLYKRMKTGFIHARPPEAPSMVRLCVSSSTSLTVSFQEPQHLNSTVVTKYRVEWSSLKDFSVLVGDAILDQLQNLKYTITGLTTGRLYFVRVSAYNMKGWGPPASSLPTSAAPSNWRDGEGLEKRQGHIESMERLLQQVRATHTHYCCGDASKLQNPSRKQSVSRSLKHLFNSNSKFIKTLKRGVYLATVLFHRDLVLVTAEDQLPLVEVDDCYSSSLMQDFLWFTKLSCMWEDVRWLRQSMSVSTSSSTTLQTRHKILTSAAHMQNLLGTHNLGRVHFEPIKDRHGNVLLVTAREAESQSVTGKWTAVTKLQSQRKSLSTPDEPTALDILTITMQDILSYQRRSSLRLAPGLYLGLLKLSSSVDQIRVLVSLRTPNVLVHARVRDNANVSREEWEWIQSLSDPESGSDPGLDQVQIPALASELQPAITSLLKQINLPLQQAGGFRLYHQQVVELGQGVAFLLMLPAADDVCSAPGQTNALCPLSGFLHLPLQMFELVHFSCYKERFISMYCRLSSVLELDSLITQQSLREAITDTELSLAKQRHQLIQDYIQSLDEMRRDLRWLTDALQFARYKQPRGGVPLSSLLSAHGPETQDQNQDQIQDRVQTGSSPKTHLDQLKSDSTSSNMDYLPTPSPSPELRRRKTGSDVCSDEDGSSEVFLPTDSDYDSDALSPRDSLWSPPTSTPSSHTTTYSHTTTSSHTTYTHNSTHNNSYSTHMTPLPQDTHTSPQSHPSSLDLSRQRSLGGSALDVLQLNELRSPISPWSRTDVPLLVHSPCSPKDTPPSPLSPEDTAETLGHLSLSSPPPPAPPKPSKRKLLSRSTRGQYFSGPHRWIRAQSGEHQAGVLSQGVYTKQSEFNDQSHAVTYVSHASCVLERRRREQRPHVRRIFVEHREEEPGEEERGEERGEGERGEDRGGGGAKEGAKAVTQDVDSDDQTNDQISEILSSTL